MLLQWIKDHPLQNILISTDAFLPYPKIEDRAAWDAYPSKLKNIAISQAEKYLDMTWPSSPATDFMEYFRSGSRSEPGRRVRRDALLSMALAECFENKGRFVDQIINGIWMICEESFWGVSAHNGVNHGVESADHDILPDVENPYIDLFASETAMMLAWTRYLLKNKLDKVTPLVVRRIDVEVERRIIWPFINRYDFWWMGFMPRNVNNWTTWICCNMLSVFLTMEFDARRRIIAVEKVCHCLDIFLDSYGADGGCDEGAHYWSRAGGSLFECLEQLRMATNGIMDFYDEPLIKNIGAYLANCHIAGKYFVNYADGGAIVSNFNSPLVYGYGKRIGNDAMMALAASKLRTFDEEEEQSMLRILPALEYYDEIAAYNKNIPPPKDIWMGDVQVAIARETEGYNGLYLAAKGGHNGESHNHNDVGSFILFADGYPGVIDLGVETYTRHTFGPNRYNIWTMRSSFHNLPVLNGCEQLAGAERRASDIEYIAESERVCFSMDIAGAYNPEAGVSHYRRAYVFDRLAGGSATIKIEDAYEFTAADNQLQLVFMTLYEPVAEANAIRIALPNGKSISMSCSDTSMKPSVEHFATNDPKLVQAWGNDGVYRASFTGGIGQRGKISMTFKIKK